jgi:hypothetical protein
MLIEVVLGFWGCMPEFVPSCTKETFDMTNNSSTWIDLIAGLAIGAIISWWIYNRQKKTSRKQDATIEHLLRLERKMILMEKSMLEKILELDQKIDCTHEKK